MLFNEKMNKFRSVIQVLNEISCCFAPDFLDSLYNIDRFFAMQNDGFTKEEIMKELNIKKSTYYNYFKVYYRRN